MARELNIQCAIRFGTGCRIAPQFAVPMKSGRVTLLFGPSGCGKTTTLRLIAGLARPDEGRIVFGEDVWADTTRRLCLPPQKRRIGFLFQNYALFSHLSVRQNLAFGLQGLPAKERQARVESLAELLEIGPLLDQMPHTLSGGQAQRVALGRTLATHPQLLLLDEPLAALDEPLRHLIGRELRELLQRTALPALMITHDQRELDALGDDLVVLSQGRVLQHGPLHEVLQHPRTVEVARILGMENILPVEQVHCHFPLPPETKGTAFLGIASEHIRFARSGAAGSCLSRLSRIEHQAGLLRLEFDAPLPLLVRITPQALPQTPLEIGRSYPLEIPREALRLLPSSGTSKPTPA